MYVHELRTHIHINRVGEENPRRQGGDEAYYNLFVLNDVCVKDTNESGKTTTSFKFEVKTVVLYD